MALRKFSEVDAYQSPKPGDVIQFIKRDGDMCIPVGRDSQERFMSSRDRIAWDQVVHVTNDYIADRSICRVYCLNTVVDPKDIILKLREKDNDD